MERTWYIAKEPSHWAAVIYLTSIDPTDPGICYINIFDDDLDITEGSIRTENVYLHYREARIMEILKHKHYGI